MTTELNELDRFTDSIISSCVKKRHKLHQLAEVSNKEMKTAKQITAWLEETSPDSLHQNIGGSGVIAVYGKSNKGPRVMFRAELDGLPIPDPENLEYRSKNPDTGHKCGHDGHMTHLLGLAKWLHKKPPEHACVMLLFQPAEETGEGAARVIDDPVFKDLKPDYMVALHNLPGYEKHQVIVREGAFTSASIGMKYFLEGSTSHAAHPEDGNSPALAVAALINFLSGMAGNSFAEHTHALTTIVHARVRDGEPAFGTTPGKGAVMATLRAAENKVLEKMVRLSKKQAKALASAWDLGLQISDTEYFKTTINNKNLTRLLKEVTGELELPFHQPAWPFPWSEDFGRFSEVSEVLLFGLGAGRKHPQLHHRNYDYPDELLVSGIRLFISIAKRLDQEK